MKFINSCLNKLNQILFPVEYCLLCQSSSSQQICHDCYQSLISKPLVTKCWKCQIVKSPQDIYCKNCIENSFVFDRVVSAFEYASPLNKILHQIKYNHKINYTSLISQLFYQQITAQITHLPDAIIPIPLHENKHKSRGFNQTHELIREFKIKKPQIEIILASRTKETQSQATLNRYSRLSNMHNAFSIDTSLQGKTIAIIDDVVTTGTTVNEMSRLCKKLGASKVEVWCLMRAHN